MLQTRLPIALDDGLITLPSDGPILVVGPTTEHDFPALPKDRVTIYSQFYPDVTFWQARGYSVECELPEKGFAAAVVCAPRSKALAQAWLHAANRATEGGLVILDGQKTDGMDSHLKALKNRARNLGHLSKAHGKLVWFQGLDAAEWETADIRLPDGFVTRPGVFSAEKIDKGSEVLAAVMPDAINGRVADLGAGWGYLSRHILSREGVEALDLIEADKVALDCARRNVDDPRARFFWDDATAFTPDQPYDVVISNPPFHTSRAGRPELGQAFIQSAARILKPSGRLVMVANRHLPYEDTLAKHFRVVEDLGGTPGFKLLAGLKLHRASR
ncbi:class I SAM-dependent methyltransferase [Aliiroseovarius sp. F20344]|uniref:class I SAM-dependent methyltransferase n=1 Tax=Aliiroseovarius sp. F20344 TaxID=2926414 RepID=UPI001FF65269|nr:class I SAM-dependent methyltransferase [Aliiroseovarius sp. F20344]MCK0140873.1 class I SAM-dependent methyltransferase [Aliiroseovarius sp. F20344]